MSPPSPKVVVHGLEEKLVAGFFEGIFQVGEGDRVSRDGDLHQVRSLLFVQMVDHFSFPHGREPGRERTRWASVPLQHPGPLLLLLLLLTKKPRLFLFFLPSPGVARKPSNAQKAELPPSPGPPLHLHLPSLTRLNHKDARLIPLKSFGKPGLGSFFLSFSLLPSTKARSWFSIALIDRCGEG